MISFSQFEGGTYAGSTITAPFANVNKGDLILAFLQITTVHLNTITDDQNNVWTISENRTPSEVGATFNIVSAWAIAKATGPCTVSWNMSGAGGGVAFSLAAVYSTSNTWSANPITVHAYADCNTGNPNTVGAMVGAKVGSMLVLWGALYTAGCVWSALTAGYTMRTGTGAGSVEGLCDLLAAAGFSNSPQMQLATNQNSFALGFVLDEINPPKTLTPNQGSIAMPAYTILPIEQE